LHGALLSLLDDLPGLALIIPLPFYHCDPEKLVVRVRLHGLLQQIV
jgi:hypothetical protein